MLNLLSKPTASGQFIIIVALSLPYIKCYSLSGCIKKHRIKAEPIVELQVPRTQQKTLDKVLCFEFSLPLIQFYIWIPLSGLKCIASQPLTLGHTHPPELQSWLIPQAIGNSRRHWKSMLAYMETNRFLQMWIDFQTLIDSSGTNRFSGGNRFSNNSTYSIQQYIFGNRNFRLPQPI